MRWSLIKRQVSQYAHHLVVQPQSTSRNKRREIGFWQRRYWEHLIRHDADFERHVDYVHYNPVKHGLVEQVRDWAGGDAVEIDGGLVSRQSERVRTAHPTWLTLRHSLLTKIFHDGSFL